MENSRRFHPISIHRLALAALILALLAACSPQPAPPTASPAPSPTPVPVATSMAPSQSTSALPAAKVLAEWQILNPSGIYVAFESVWVPGHHSESTTRIDPATNQVSAVIKGTGFRAEQALAVGDALWVSGQSNDTIWIDPTTNTVAPRASAVKGQLHSLGYAFDSLWITTHDQQLLRVNPATSEILATIRLETGIADCQNTVLTTPDAIWVEVCDFRELAKVDPATNTVAVKIAHSQLLQEAQAQTVVPPGKGGEFIWLSCPPGAISPGSAAGLLRVDPHTGQGLTFLPLSPEQAGDGALAVADDSVWLGGNAQVTRVNSATNQIDASYATVSGSNNHVALGFGSVWLENYDLNLVQRLDLAP